MWIGVTLSGPVDFDGFAFLMAVRTWFIVMVIGVVSRL